MMSLLSSLALWEWDVLVFWFMVASSAVFLLVLLATVFLQEEQPSTNSQQDSLFIQQTVCQKILPIAPGQGWKLAGIHCNLRTWTRSLNMPSSTNSQFTSATLQGCSTVLAGEPEDILSTIQNITKQPEWDPTIASIQQTSPPKITDDVDGDYPVLMDVIHTTTAAKDGVELPNANGGLRHTVAWWLSRLSVVRKVSNPEMAVKNSITKRLWKVERDGSCWMLSKCDEVNGSEITWWTYCFLQPVLEISGKSFIQFVVSPLFEFAKSPDDIGQRLASRVAALRQHLAHAQLKLRPLALHATLQPAAIHLSAFLDDNKPLDLRDSKPLEQTRRASDTSQPKKVTTTKVKKPTVPMSALKRKQLGSSRSKRLRARPVGGTVNAGEDDSSSSEDTGYSDWTSNKGSLERDAVAVAGQLTSNNDPGVMTNMIDFMLSDGDALCKDSYGELGTLAKQCTAELLAQSVQVDAINVRSTVADQKTQTGGWFFHSLAKDVVILQKNPVLRKYHCFLGKGLIHASPEEVFKAVKNPRSRFIYDNMLKKMDIVKELNDNLQIVYAVHEVPHLLRKESRDFCVLQASSVEGSTHVVSFTSVNIKDCPSSDAISRSYVLPSGWVIRRVGDEQVQYSMVTYMVQVSIGSKGIPASFLHFLAKRVPLSVAYLRMFVEAEHM